MHSQSILIDVPSFKLSVPFLRLYVLDEVLLSLHFYFVVTWYYLWSFVMCIVLTYTCIKLFIYTFIYNVKYQFRENTINNIRKVCLMY